MAKPRFVLIKLEHASPLEIVFEVELGQKAQILRLTKYTQKKSRRSTLISVQ
jgi:hypothetical protein